VERKVDLRKVLNPSQYEAVTTVDGPLLVLAGAGSGKTRVITYRIYYLINEMGVPPASILGVTFTNKAAEEMKERVVNLCGRDARYVNLMTFHSLGNKILRETAPLIGLESNFTIFDQDDQKSLVREVIRDLGLSTEYYEAGSIVNMISRFKNEGKLPDDISVKELDPNIVRIYRNYEEKMRQNNALDFGDLLLRTYILFEENPKVLEYYQDLYRYILVDEFQDTNFIQYEIIKMLAGKHKNICVVGDEDQTIYTWRGAEPDNVFQFARDFQGTKIIKLEENYRSTGKILEVANTLISKNRKRMGKRLWTRNPPGEEPVLRAYVDEIQEASWVADQVMNLARSGYSFKDMAVFYRMNYQSRVLEEEFVRRRIPYQVVGNLKFYDRKETKDIIAYLRVIYNPKENLSLSRIINVPPRGIGEKTFQEVKRIAEARGISYWEAIELLVSGGGIAGRKLQPFYFLISSYLEKKVSMNVYEMAMELIEDLEYDDYLYRYDSKNAEGRIANVEELLASMKIYVENTDSPSLGDYLEKVALISDADTIKDEDSVSLMTLHASKGLEFQVVFIVGLSDGILPHVRSRESEDELEEERRLFYVGITRAREKLFLSYSSTRRTYYGATEQMEPSIFLREIGLVPLKSQLAGREESRRPVEMNNQRIRGGTIINHPKWGKGVIVKIDGSRVTILFESVGEKLLSLEFVEKIAGKD